MGAFRREEGRETVGWRRVDGFEWMLCAEKEPAEVLEVAREREEEAKVEEVMLLVDSR